MATKTRQQSTTLRCENCGDEAQIIGAFDDPDYDPIDEIEKWNSEHEDCALPVAARSIATFNSSLSPLGYRWRAGDPAPDWMGHRPAWAADHHDTLKGFCPTDCFWASDDIVMPLLHHHGAKSDDKSWRTLGTFEARLRQGMNDRHPIVELAYGPKGNISNLSLTFDEAHTLINALRLLMEIGGSG